MITVFKNKIQIKQSFIKYESFSNTLQIKSSSTSEAGIYSVLLEVYTPAKFLYLT